MATHGKRSQGDAALISALLAGQTVQDAAASAGLSVSSAHRRLHDAAFCRELGAARQAALAQAVTRLCGATVAATDALAALTTGATQETVRLAAARATLDFALRGAELLDIEARLTALEARLAPAGTRNGRAHALH